MARNKNRGRGGRGGGRGRGGQPDGRQPQGNIPGVVNQRQNHKQKSGRGGGGGSGNHSSRKKGGNNAAAVKEQVPEDGMLRHQELLKAHSDAVMAITITEDSIYTASRDKILKRWKVQPGAPGRFELKPDVEVPLPDQCLCMVYIGEWLFCGLQNAGIRGFAKSGKQMDLTGHTKKVTCVLLHEVVLLSGSADQTIRLWQMDPASQTMGCTHTIGEGIPGPVICMLVLGAFLWVGGTSGVAIVDLAALRVVHQLGPRQGVANIVAYEGHAIVIYSDGSMTIYDGQGNQTLKQSPTPAGPVLSAAGLEVGPRLLIGHAKGQLSSIELPMFTMRTYWQAFQRCRVQSIACAGHDGIFIIGAENGSLQLWQKHPVP